MLHATSMEYLPGSSRYVNVCLFWQVFAGETGTNFTDVEDPGTYNKPAGVIDV